MTDTLQAHPGSARTSFGSDNHAGAHPSVLAKITAANSGHLPAYGSDPWTSLAEEQIRALSGARGGVYFVFNGTAANVLALSLLLRPFEAVICAESAHLNTDECGAPERVLGSKLLTVPAPDGKLTPELVASRLGGRGDEHRAQPRVVAIAQSTELGTCYTIGELRALSEFCRGHGLRLFLDGARLTNAIAQLGCELADVAACVDVLSFGGTKNGAVGAEAVIVMDPALAAAAPFQRKQQMQLASKMRFLAAQFLALLEDDLWLRSARHANDMAARLAAGVRGLPGVRLCYPVQANAVFAALDPAHIRVLQRDWEFHVWDPQTDVVRWMTAFDTTESDVDLFVAAIRTVTEGTGPAQPGRDATVA
jgi:threonine aldolase